MIHAEWLLSKCCLTDCTWPLNLGTSEEEGMWDISWHLCWNTLVKGSSLFQRCVHLMGGEGFLLLNWDFYGLNSAAFNKSLCLLDIFVFLVEVDAHITVVRVQLYDHVLAEIAHIVSLCHIATPNPCTWFLGSGVFEILSVRQNSVKPKWNQNKTHALAPIL